jgi:hypothetical protein
MDERQMTAFVDRAVADVGALLGGALVVLGDKLGLDRAMAGTDRQPQPGATSARLRTKSLHRASTNPILCAIRQTQAHPKEH